MPPLGVRGSLPWASLYHVLRVEVGLEVGCGSIIVFLDASLKYHMVKDFRLAYSLKQRTTEGCLQEELGHTLAKKEYARV